MRTRKLVWGLLCVFSLGSVACVFARATPDYANGLRFDTTTQSPAFIVDLAPVKSIKANNCGALFVPTKTAAERSSFVSSSTASSCITWGDSYVTDYQVLNGLWGRDNPFAYGDYETVSVVQGASGIGCSAGYSAVDVYDYAIKPGGKGGGTFSVLNKTNGFCKVNNSALADNCGVSCSNGYDCDPNRYSSCPCSDYKVRFTCMEGN